MSSKLIWLASYPKSGNTWFRSFLTAYLNGEVNINQLATNGIFSSKVAIEVVLDLCTDDLTTEEVIQFRKLAWSHKILHSKESSLFVKIHDAYTFNPWDGKAIIPTFPDNQAVYLVRNPLDVVLSFANHNDQSIQQTIDHFICNSNGAFLKKNKSFHQLYQLMGTWSMHVESWLRQTQIPVHIIRYEDMKEDPLAVFKEALKVMGLDAEEEKVKKAIDLSSFQRLKEQEKREGFLEKTKKSVVFFNKGETGRWKNELNFEQIQQILQANEPMMKKFGYWQDAIDFLNK
ncbi:sulfotransferase domain-containing protein [Mongoliitalea lutea]|uniref:Sulfotransferase n=1 Tax=Mongoliitalea lutea TaxID=849756 RepID=A0A8J3G5L5_9BACT|nr:sulfotransferase domain-containing protein [Mongoliitalea lutea]GHB36998.1 sulfotransferase [Mongoliitalea lutea]